MANLERWLLEANGMTSSMPLLGSLAHVFLFLHPALMIPGHTIVEAEDLRVAH